MNETKSTFEDLEIWQLSRVIRNRISQLTKRFPADEKYRLSDQLLRSSRSVTANIAEGYGRFHFQENIQFCRQSRGSLYEILDHLSVAADEKYIEEELFKTLKEDILVIIKKLNGYINYLEKRKAEI